MVLVRATSGEMIVQVGPAEVLVGLSVELLIRLSVDVLVTVLVTEVQVLISSMEAMLVEPNTSVEVEIHEAVVVQGPQTVDAGVAVTTTVISLMLMGSQTEMPRPAQEFWSLTLGSSEGSKLTNVLRSSMVLVASTSGNVVQDGGVKEVMVEVLSVELDDEAAVTVLKSVALLVSVLPLVVVVSVLDKVELSMEVLDELPAEVLSVEVPAMVLELEIAVPDEIGLSVADVIASVLEEVAL